MATLVTSRLSKAEYAQMVIEAISDKLGERQLECWVCRDFDWEVQEYKGVLPATDQFGDMDDLSQISASFPLAAIVCNTCGYSILLNLYKLGVAEALGLPPTL